MSTPNVVLFPAVKTVLDTIIQNWTKANGSPPDLTGAHGPSFMWATKQQLLAAKFVPNAGAPIPLIQPEIIGKSGLGHTANIVVDLVTGLTIPAGHLPRMPLGGLGAGDKKYLDPAGPEIKTLIDWIEGGCQG